MGSHTAAEICRRSRNKVKRQIWNQKWLFFHLVLFLSELQFWRHFGPLKKNLMGLLCYNSLCILWNQNIKHNQLVLFLFHLKSIITNSTILFRPGFHCHIFLQVLSHFRGFEPQLRRIFFLSNLILNGLFHIL